MEGAYFQCCLLGSGIVGGQHKQAPSGPMGRCEEAQTPDASSQAEVPTSSPGLRTPTQRPLARCPVVPLLDGFLHQTALASPIPHWCCR